MKRLWVDTPNYSIRGGRDLLPLFIDKKMAEPDLGFRYNNSGYVVLGIIVEEISKLSFDEYVEKNILIPAGM